MTNDDLTVTGVGSMQWNRTNEPVDPTAQGVAADQLPPIDPQVQAQVKAAIAAEAATLS